MSFQPLTSQEVQELVERSDHVGPIKQLALHYTVMRDEYLRERNLRRRDLETIVRHEALMLEQSKEIATLRGLLHDERSKP